MRYGAASMPTRKYYLPTPHHTHIIRARQGKASSGTKLSKVSGKHDDAHHAHAAFIPVVQYRRRVAAGDMKNQILARSAPCNVLGHAGQLFFFDLWLGVTTDRYSSR